MDPDISCPWKLGSLSLLMKLFALLIRVGLDGHFIAFLTAFECWEIYKVNSLPAQRILQKQFIFKVHRKKQFAVKLIASPPLTFEIQS